MRHAICAAVHETCPPAPRYRRIINKGMKQMDKDRIEGSLKQAAGAVKEGFGKMTGDTKVQAEGAAEKAAGKVQNTVGGVKDGVRDATK
jgi:uncharacterized protein YjbJ (UPF0337 family)